MALPPVWMFVLGAAAVVTVVTIGVVIVHELQKDKKVPVETKSRGSSVRTPQREETPCLGCDQNNASITFSPCGHRIMCRPCVVEYFKSERCERCPEINCRMKIEDIKSEFKKKI